MNSHERQADIEARLVLLALSGMGPSRIRWLLTEQEEPGRVLSLLASGRLPQPARPAPPGVRPETLSTWKAELAAIDPLALYRRQIDQGWTILLPGDTRWPFTDEPEPPLMLFCDGDPDLLAHRPAVAVVGTRRCTSVGRTVAHQLGGDLAHLGVAVVSGLALGVDAAAHHGTLDAGGVAVGVVGTGLDVIYPKRNRSLWADVSRVGLLVSEYSAGAQPDRWHFPARNRLIASLSDGVVIVESHTKGGSLLTADEAIDRGVSVMAVPGAVVNSAADGSNALIIDGAIPVRDAADVVMAIGFQSVAEPEREREVRQERLWEQPFGGETAANDGLSSDDGQTSPNEVIGATDLIDLIMTEVGNGSVSIDQLVVLSGCQPPELVAAVDSLVRRGVVDIDGTTVTWRPEPHSPRK